MEDIAFIGGGNMVRALIGGLVPHTIPAANVHVGEPVDALRDGLARDFGVHVSTDNAAIAQSATTWVFGVKPQVMRAVCESLASIAQRTRPLIVSMAAGITTTQLERWLGGNLPVVRTMPNTPALLGA